MAHNFSDYSAADIISISSVEHIRRRPAMYIGGTDERGVQSMIKNIIEMMAHGALKHVCQEIDICLNDQYKVGIADRGLGMEVALSNRGNYDFEDLIETQFTPGGYGLYGSLYREFMGFIPDIVVINALSEWFTVEIRREGQLWRKIYHQGVPTTPLQISPLPLDEPTGTTFIFQPDFSIMQKHDWDFWLILARCLELVAMVPDLKITLRDERTNYPPQHLHLEMPNGLRDYLDLLRGQATPLHEPFYGTGEFELVKDDPPTKISFAVQFIAEPQGQTASFINTNPTIEGGTHLEALKRAVVDAVNLSEGKNLTWADLAPYCLGIISVYHPRPYFAGTLNNQLTSPEVYEPSFDLVYKTCTQNQPNWIQAILERIKP